MRGYSGVESVASMGWNSHLCHVRAACRPWPGTGEKQTDELVSWVRMALLLRSPEHIFISAIIYLPTHIYISFFSNWHCGFLQSKAITPLIPCPKSWLIHPWWNIEVCTAHTSIPMIFFHGKTFFLFWFCCCFSFLRREKAISMAVPPPAQGGQALSTPQLAASVPTRGRRTLAATKVHKQPLYNEIRAQHGCLAAGRHTGT